METHQQNGEKYPVKTLYQLLCGINYYVHSIDPVEAPNLADKDNPKFKELHSIMDSTFACRSGEEEIGAEMKHAFIISKDEENNLWEQGMLGVTTPLSLL